MLPLSVQLVLHPCAHLQIAGGGRRPRGGGRGERRGAGGQTAGGGERDACGHLGVAPLHGGEQRREAADQRGQTAETTFASYPCFIYPCCGLCFLPLFQTHCGAMGCTGACRQEGDSDDNDNKQDAPQDDQLAPPSSALRRAVWVGWRDAFSPSRCLSTPSMLLASASVSVLCCLLGFVV